MFWWQIYMRWRRNYIPKSNKLKFHTQMVVKEQTTHWTCLLREGAALGNLYLMLQDGVVFTFKLHSLVLDLSISRFYRMSWSFESMYCPWYSSRATCKCKDFLFPYRFQMATVLRVFFAVTVVEWGQLFTELLVSR